MSDNILDIDVSIDLGSDGMWHWFICGINSTGPYEIHVCGSQPSLKAAMDAVTAWSLAEGYDTAEVSNIRGTGN